MEVAKLCTTIGSSLIGETVETQEVSDFVQNTRFYLTYKRLKLEDINDALEKIKNERVRFRYIVDMKSLKNQEIPG